MPYGKTLLTALSTAALLAGPGFAEMANESDDMADELTTQDGNDISERSEALGAEPGSTSGDTEELVPTDDYTTSERDEEQIDQPVTDVDVFEEDEAAEADREVGRDEPRTSVE